MPGACYYKDWLNAVTFRQDLDSFLSKATPLQKPFHTRFPLIAQQSHPCTKEFLSHYLYHVCISYALSPLLLHSTLLFYTSPLYSHLFFLCVGISFHRILIYYFIHIFTNTNQLSNFFIPYFITTPYSNHCFEAIYIYTSLILDLSPPSFLLFIPWFFMKCLISHT